MKRIKLFLSALLLSVSSLFVLAAPQAFAAMRTWDGGGGDNNLSTAANWSGDVAPSAGDDLVFPANIADVDLTNDYTAATSFNSITFSGTATQNTAYSIDGNSMTLVAGITHSMTGSFSTGVTIDMPLILNGTQTFDSGSSYIFINGTLNLGSSALTVTTSGSMNIVGVISGTGSITKSGTGDVVLRGVNLYSGTTTVSTGTLVIDNESALGTAVGGTTVASGASLYIYKATGDMTIAEPLTLSGSGSGAYSGVVSLGVSYGMGGGGATPPFPLTTFSGAITLQSNTMLSAGARDGKITGAITGNYTIGVLGSSLGSFEIASSANGSATPNQALEAPVTETKYESDTPSTSISVNNNETAIVTGTYGAVNVGLGGTLKGTGTVGTLYVYGKVSPGLSPGCLTTTGDLTFITGSTYDFEIAGTTACTQYDQLKVTGAVTLDGTLNTLLINGFKPKAGQKYVLISNDGADPISGTFTGLAQGAKVTVGAYEFTISYTGGDGNDVELTVTAGAPDTGFNLLMNNPFVTMSVMLGAAGAIALMARRNLKLSARRR